MKIMSESENSKVYPLSEKSKVEWSRIPIACNSCNVDFLMCT